MQFMMTLTSMHYRIDKCLSEYALPEYIVIASRLFGIIMR